MFGKKFGMAMAKRAGEFAKTEEQKRTVLAVVRMLDIPILVKEQCDTLCEKLTSKIGFHNEELIALHDKADVVKHDLQSVETEHVVTEALGTEWDLTS